MKQITIELDPDDIMDLLANIESKISAKQRTREQLSGEIAKLEQRAKSLRDQLHGVNGMTARKPRGENRSRIIDYLRTLNGHGTRMSEISRATGIRVSSTAFTLRNYSNDFEQDKRTALWKLK